MWSTSSLSLFFGLVALYNELNVALAFTFPSDMLSGIIPHHQQQRQPFIATPTTTPTMPANTAAAPSKATVKTTTTTTTTTANNNDNNHGRQAKVEKQKREWINRSVEYYSKVMREERRKNMGQISEHVNVNSVDYQEEFHQLAKKHYFALRKIKNGQHRHAEIIYRRIINELMREEEEDGHQCDHAKLAVTTLLLALHMQRMGNIKQTRSVFLNFFRVVVLSGDTDTECACSAKVLGAYALFEMKQGNSIKSFEIAKRAVKFDPALEPVLQWRQFREVHNHLLGATSHASSLA